MEAGIRRLYARLKLPHQRSEERGWGRRGTKVPRLLVWIAQGRKVKLRVASETWKRMKERVRMLNSTHCGEKHSGRVRGVG